MVAIHLQVDEIKPGDDGGGGSPTCVSMCVYRYIYI